MCSALSPVLHFIQFEHWPLRWIYFVLGLSGCAMIATGYVYWLEARRRRPRGQGVPGMRLVAGLTVGAVTGILIATPGLFYRQPAAAGGRGVPGL